MITLSELLKHYSDTNTLPNLPKAESGNTYKGFIVLNHIPLSTPWMITGIIGLDDNKQPKELVVLNTTHIFFDTKLKIEKKEVLIEKLNTPLSAYIYSSNKYKFKIIHNEDNSSTKIEVIE